MTDAEKLAVLIPICREFDRLALVISSAVRADERNAAGPTHREVMAVLAGNVKALRDVGELERRPVSGIVCRKDDMP